jgi:hypothetical protein
MTAVLSGTNGLLQSYDYQAPTTGFSYTFAAGVQVLVLDPAGTLATGTITMPAAPADGMTITFSSDQQITALTMAGNGASINNAVTLLPAKTSVTYVYRATGTTWWPTQNVPGILTNGMQFFRLNADLAGANATGAQSILGVGVTLAASTVYAFQMYFLLSKAAGATSRTVSLGFGGTATLNNLVYNGVVNSVNSAYPTGGLVATPSTIDNNSAAAAVITAASTSTTTQSMCNLQGTVSINAGGTFIPQYTLSAAPGGAFSTVAGSYMLIYPIGASGANVNVGSWA